ncbi:thiamine-phosphate pyrophosphorylase, partial [bacterium]
MNKTDLKKIYRILDVNYNRCKEGLRVVEDYLRFYAEDENNMKKVRAFRHGFENIFEENYKELITARDSQGDYGRKITEQKRKSIQ